jgi:hypothetical protein
LRFECAFAPVDSLVVPLGPAKWRENDCARPLETGGC